MIKVLGVLYFLDPSFTSYNSRLNHIVIDQIVKIKNQLYNFIIRFGTPLEFLLFISILKIYQKMTILFIFLYYLTCEN